MEVSFALRFLVRPARPQKANLVNCSKEVSDMTLNEVDAYLDFFEDKVVPEHQLPRRELCYELSWRPLLTT